MLEELVDMDSIDGARNIDYTGVADEIRLGVAVTVPVFFLGDVLRDLVSRRVGRG